MMMLTTVTPLTLSWKGCRYPYTQATEEQMWQSRISVMPGCAMNSSDTPPTATACANKDTETQ